MVRRLTDLLSRAERTAEAELLRPNQLRLQDVVAERRRREATRQAVRPAPPESDPHSPRPATTPPQPATPPPSPPSSSALRAALSSRDDLRQAMLLREVLDPPLSLRDQEFGRFRFW
jgi:hypothetical protein